MQNSIRVQHRRRVSGIALLLVLCLAAGVHAADQVVSDCSEAGLRQKITDAQNSGGGTITFACGSTQTIDLSNQVLPLITTNITIDGGNNITIDGHYTTRILYVYTGGALTLKNITLTRGNSSGVAFGTQDGGAVVNIGTLDVQNAKFLYNHTPDTSSGSAIYSFGPLNVTNCEFAVNQGGGGALKVRSSGATTMITGSSFHDNIAVDSGGGGYGGGMQIFDGPSVTVSNSTFSGNAATYGGGIYVTANSTLNASDCTFNRNGVVGTRDPSAGTGAGGGVYNGGIATLTSCTFSGNGAMGGQGGTVGAYGTAGGFGQGAALCNVGTATVTNCTLFGNQSTGGAGGSLLDSGYGGNGGQGEGGGIYNSGSLTVVNCTLSGNSAVAGAPGRAPYGDGYPGIGQGGGVFQETTGSNNVENDLIANNAATTSGPDVFGAFNSHGHNLVANADGGTGFGGNDLVGADPKLGPLQNNGGATDTQALLSDSPAINAANPDAAPPTDQRGFYRAGAPDIGAFEVKATYYAANLQNISTRGFVGTGNSVLIGGMIIHGTGPKKVLVRAIGPTLGQFGLSSVLQNPTLDLYHTVNNTQVVVTSNDNWIDSANKQEIIDTGLAPPNNLEAAILMDLEPGNYTAIVRGVNGTTGNALVDAFDINQTTPNQFGNISTRGLVQTGNNVLIAGLIVNGPQTQNVLLRGLGPTLSQFGVSNVLANPLLELVEPNGMRITNDNWTDAANASGIAATGLQPPNNLESAILMRLPAGNYTAILSGVNNTTGNALVEVYAVQ
jgi:hypothetical protein